MMRSPWWLTFDDARFTDEYALRVGSGGPNHQLGSPWWRPVIITKQERELAVAEAAADAEAVAAKAAWDAKARERRKVIELYRLSRALYDAALAARRPRKFAVVDNHIVEVVSGGW